MHCHPHFPGEYMMLRTARVLTPAPTLAAGETRRPAISLLAIGDAFADVDVSDSTWHCETRPRVTLQRMTTVQSSWSMSAFDRSRRDLA